MKKKYEFTLKNNYLQVLEYQMLVGEDMWTFARNVDFPTLYTFYYSTMEASGDGYAPSGLRLICPQTAFRYQVQAFTSVTEEGETRNVPTLITLNGEDVPFEIIMDYLTRITGGTATTM